MGVLTRSEINVLAALAESILPSGRLGPGGIDAGVIDYIDTFLSNQLPAERVKLRAMIQLIERGIAGQALSPFLRFTTASESQREAWLNWLETNPRNAVRSVFQALRSLFMIAYMENPEVRRAMGQQPQGNP
jgi:hypothetical protein